MTWGAIGAAAVGTVGGALLSDKGGGGTATQTKDPWSAAVPWLTSNLGIGQNLQGAYQANPFNPLQQTSYANLLSGNDYINQMLPGLLGQMGQQTGFDRSNPRARPMPFQFPAMPAYQPTAGLLGASTGMMNQVANPFANGAIPPAPAPSAAPAISPTDPNNIYNIAAWNAAHMTDNPGGA